MSEHEPEPAQAREPDYVASTRLVFDRTADLYVELVGTSITPRYETAIDRAALDTFAEMVLTRGGGAVLDVGCGTGRATSYLAERGLNIGGTDLSLAMIEKARLAHPDLRFDEGSLTKLPAADSALVGAVYWYSIIYTPLDQLSAVWTELKRVLQVDGTVLVAFQAGENERVERKDVHGSAADLVVFRHSLDDVAASLSDAGFDVNVRIHREPDLDHETTPQAFLLAEPTAG
ncbi:MAG: class I SAM-dependent methyltransferase [Acidimicrobiales bacterium]